MSRYLKVEEAESKLSSEAITINETYDLETIINQIETIIDTELDISFGVQEKVEILTPGDTGMILLNHIPVQTILTVERVVQRHLEQTPEAIAARRNGETGNHYETTTFLWDEDNRIKVFYPCSRYRVTYLVGHDVPAIAVQTVYDILKLHLINRKSTLNWLYEPTRDKTSLSLPEGVSGSAKISDTGHKNQLERLISPLKKKYGKNNFYF